MVEISFKLDEIANDDILDYHGKIINILDFRDSRHHRVDYIVCLFQGLATCDQERSRAVDRDVAIVRLQSIAQPVAWTVGIVNAAIKLGGYQR